jgi:hypothetical protein
MRIQPLLLYIGVGLFLIPTGCGSNGNTGQGKCDVVPGSPPPAVAEIVGMAFHREAPPPIDLAIEDPSRAQHLYDLTLALPVFPPGTYDCPVDYGVRYELTFSRASGDGVTITLDPNGCQNVLIPGTCVRRATDKSYWTRLAEDLGICESGSGSAWQLTCGPDASVPSES